MHRSNPDEICALCDEFTLKGVKPEYAALGMGLCQVSEEGKARIHVAWDGRTCVSFRLDVSNLALRRKHVADQRRTAGTNDGVEE